MKLVAFEVPLLDKPKLEPGLIFAILQEICNKNIHFDQKWTDQVGQEAELIGLLREIVGYELFQSNKKCVIQVSLHTLTLTLNLPQIRKIIQIENDLFLSILNQLETLPSNRFYFDAVCFRNPYARPKYSPELRNWVHVHHLWIDSVRPNLGSSLFRSKFDSNHSTGNVNYQY